MTFEPYRCCFCAAEDWKHRQGGNSRALREFDEAIEASTPNLNMWTQEARSGYLNMVSSSSLDPSPGLFSMSTDEDPVVKSPLATMFALLIGAPSHVDLKIAADGEPKHATTMFVQLSVGMKGSSRPIDTQYVRFNRDEDEQGQYIMFEWPGLMRFVFHMDSATGETSFSYGFITDAETTRGDHSGCNWVDSTETIPSTAFATYMAEALVRHPSRRGHAGGKTVMNHRRRVPGAPCPPALRDIRSLERFPCTRVDSYVDPQIPDCR